MYGDRGKSIEENGREVNKWKEGRRETCVEKGDRKEEKEGSREGGDEGREGGRKESLSSFPLHAYSEADDWQQTGRHSLCLLACLPA